MTTLADAVLSLVRTRSELWRWSTANAHGRQMHDAVDILEGAIPTADPSEVYSVTHKALASALKVIARADDSSGIIGDACRRLLELHPRVAHAAGVPPARLVTWMMQFQLDDDVDYFTLDPVAYAPALGEVGMAAYRTRLAEHEATLGPRSTAAEQWRSPHAHDWSVLEWNAQRLAVLDRDVDAIIRTHAKDRRVAARLEDTARAFEEIGMIDLAISWARQATDHDLGHQALRAGDYWCGLLESHRPDDALKARLYLFRRWPSSSTATRLHKTAGDAWPNHHDEVLTTLATSPSEAVTFTLHTLRDARSAWDLAHSLALDSDDVWESVVDAYEKVDPLATLPVARRLVTNRLVNTGAEHYRWAARRLAVMRLLAAGTSELGAVDEFIAELRETHRRRPRLQQEFDRARLP